MLKNYSFAILLFIISNIKLYSQEEIAKNPDPYTNPVILKHYSVAELQAIQASDSIKFNSIVYYYTQSFSIEKVDCPTCENVNIAKFDISKYEYLRKKSERYVRHAEKYGFILTLLSIDEMTYKLPIHIQQ
jgi:hypothetical protein